MIYYLPIHSFLTKIYHGTEIPYVFVFHNSFFGIQKDETNSGKDTSTAGRTAEKFTTGVAGDANNRDATTSGKTSAVADEKMHAISAV
jgi:hypothetical protein